MIAVSTNFANARHNALNPTLDCLRGSKRPCVCWDTSNLPSSASRLPRDIWELVVYHIPQPELGKLLSVNRVLFNIVLDARYKKVEWVTLDQKLIRCLARLQNPFIAGRVRHLRIRPWFLQYLLLRETLSSQERSRSARVNLNVQQQIWTAIRTLLKSPSARTAEANHFKVFRGTYAGSGYVASLDEVMSAMINAVRRMVNVTVCEFQWRDMTLRPEAVTLLETARAAFSASLIKLVLHARISTFEQILPFTDFRGLTDLEFDFDFDPWTNDADQGTANELVLVRRIAPFINHLGSSLRSLKLVTSTQGDPSAFLRALGPFPKLRTISLPISSQISDPASISDFLQQHHSSLVSVELRPDGDDGTKRLIHAQAWSALSTLCLTNTSWLKNLDALTIPAHHYPAALSLIRHAPASLTSFRLSNRYLGDAEAAELMDLLGARPGLRNLSIELQRLTPELIALLANSLPGLFSLTVILGSSYTGRYLEDFERGRYRSHIEWQLFDLSVFFEYYRDESFEPIGATYDEHRFMRLLSQTVFPNVQSFNGRGHMMYPWK